LWKRKLFSHVLHTFLPAGSKCSGFEFQYCSATLEYVFNKYKLVCRKLVTSISDFSKNYEEKNNPSWISVPGVLWKHT